MIAPLAWTIAGMQLVGALPFLVEMVAGLLPPRRRAPIEAGTLPSIAILMPAHDEGRHLAATLAALRPVLPPDAAVLVVADNCTDDTATVARTGGATVIERTDLAHRGKGFALACGRDWLMRDPPQVVIVLDADCRAEPGALVRLASHARRSGRPVQGLYLLEPAADAAAMVQISTFAFLVKNLVRQRGLDRLGAPLALGGTGMALPWPLFRDAALATGDLVEDLTLSIDLARAGMPARFDGEVRIWSDAAGADATLGQRARWEGGFLHTARTQAPRLIGTGMWTGRPGLVWMGLHVATPPLAALMLGEMGAWLATLAALAFGGPGRAVLLSSLVLCALGGTVLAAWGLHGRRWLRAATLLRLPLYVAWKVPLYLRLLAGRGPRGWVRTERGG